jgi:hypothetical protein
MNKSQTGKAMQQQKLTSTHPVSEVEEIAAVKKLV